MTLRKPQISDYQFIYETLLDWPLTDRGPTTLDSAIKWTRRWVHRNDEVCLIAEESEPVGLIAYRRSGDEVEIDYLAVHPDHRGQGHANAIQTELHQMLVADGVTVGRFLAIDGPIADQVTRGKFANRGRDRGKQGLSVVRGEVTADMDV